jgi:hypothetical protein
MEKQIEEIENQIAEIAKLITEGARSAMEDAEALYNAGYRKIYDDHQRQCTCYALGCQMAESLKRDVAEEIFAEIEEIAMHSITSFGLQTMVMGKVAFAELKKKYTEGGE